MKRKVWSGLMIVVLLVGCLAGCSGNGGSAPTSAPASVGGSQSTPTNDTPALKGPGNVTLKRLGYNVAWDPSSSNMVEVISEATGYDVLRPDRV